MLARINTFAIDGVDARPVWAEVDVRPGLPSFHIAGLADAAMREARERVRGALLGSDFSFPANRITANLAPAHLRKVGSGFDAALAVGILAATRQCSGERLETFGIYGELTLSGELRPSRGTLAAAQAARRGGLRGLIVPRPCAIEAAAVEGLQVAAVDDLPALVRVLAGDELPALPSARATSADDGPDIAEIRGQQNAVRALEIAAAGGHHLLLLGARGSGVLALARRLPGLLPPLSHDESLEVTRIRSIAGLHDGGGLVTARPFRAPHPAITSIGLIGGARPITLGEATLSHRGVLLLDDLPAFDRLAVQAVRAAAADGQLIVVRGSEAVKVPTRFMLVATASPCPGGCRNDSCQCSGADLTRYRTRLAALGTAFEMRVSVEAPDSLSSPATTTSEIRERVLVAREILRHSPGVPSRTWNRQALRLAKTIAALDRRDHATPEDLAEATTYTPATAPTSS